MSAAEDIRVAKLPKWAQQRIALLERTVAYHKAELAVGPEDSDTFADPYGTPRPLGRGTTIVFTGHGNVQHGTGRVSVRRQDDGKLYVMCDDAALIRPCSSNTFTIESARHR